MYHYLLLQNVLPLKQSSQILYSDHTPELSTLLYTPEHVKLPDRYPSSPMALRCADKTFMYTNIFSL